MLGFLILVWICIFLLFLFIQILRPKNFPPGPRPLPLFVNLLELNISNPLKDFERLADRYGKVYSLFLGSKPWVVLNSFEVFKEALLTKAVNFAGRPQDLMANKWHLHIIADVILSDYGPSWKEHRRFALMTLRNFGLGRQSMEERILGEVSHVIAKLGKKSSFDPQTMFHNAASYHLLLFGSRYDYDDEFLKLFIHLYTENAKFANGPWALVRHFISLKHFNFVFYFVFFIVQIKGSGLYDIKFKNEYPFFILYIKMLQCLNLILTPLNLNKHGLVFSPAKCQKEIDEVLEGKDHASYEDRHNMPYTLAVIHEVQRVANTVPLSVFHCTTKDIELMGYRTFVIPNLTSVLKEEGQWKFPHEFNPANFLNEQGQFEKPEAFMAFSAGRRVCLVEGLARMELFLIMVTLLRRFQFVWPDDAGEPDYTPVYGITMTPKPYRMHIRRRETVRF
uniref:Cytochrome P450, family 2, subfamily X, polypeptide 9 n=1 Tax=Sinocyclocheilus anshuiensis TaxID=1608454 RepID=A0A671MYX9_9TELE